MMAAGYTKRAVREVAAITTESLAQRAQPDPL